MRKFLTLAIGGLLAGCSTLQLPPDAPAEPASPSTPNQPITVAPPVPIEQPAPPASELAPELLYELLVAEFAGQRGDLALSAQNYLRAAKATRDPRVTKRAVRVAIYSRDYAGAQEGAHLWVELAPNSIEARQSLAALQLKAGQVDAAAENLKVVLAAFDGDTAQGFGLTSNLLSRERNGENALAVMRQLVADHPDDSGALYAYAHLANQVGEYETALKSLDRVLTTEPESVKALVLKANVLHRLGEPDSAVAAMQAALDADSENTDLRLSYARLLIDARRLDAARREFRRLERDLPDDADISYALGLLAMQAEELDEAERYFMKLLEAGNRKNEAAYALGQIAESRKDPEQAIQWYASVSGDNYMDARLRVAQIIAEQDGLEPARDYLNTLELAAPEQRLRRIIAEGRLLQDAGRQQEAMALYSEGLKAFPGNSDLLYARAMAAERIDRIDLLERDLHAILAEDPDNTQALNALGYTLADRTDRFEEARGYIERAYEQSPDDPAVIDSMGWVLYRLGDHQGALTHLRRALSLQPDAEIAAHLGEVLWVSGQHEEASEVWKQALEYAPDHKLLQSVIQRYEAP